MVELKLDESKPKQPFIFATQLEIARNTLTTRFARSKTGNRFLGALLRLKSEKEETHAKKHPIENGQVVE